MHHLIRPGLALALALPSTLAFAQTAPAVGDRGVAIADAPVPRPEGTPCVAKLYTDVAFDDHGEATSRAAKPREWRYAPPAQCAGPWSKVVLEADFSVTAGRQYDRTVSLWLKGVNLFYGTTQEPGAKVSPHWHVERDVTDYAGLFQDAGHGQTVLNNWIDATRTGVIQGSARLVFYPATATSKAAAPADLAIGLVGDSDGHPVDVQNGNEALSRSVTLPRNVEHIVLDLIAQSQAVDEQWYMCIDDADMEPTREFSLGPPNAGDPLEQCPGGNFREVAVSIDGQPAGRAPVYPWTYTGGVDPNLWRPTTDIQTLNFTPYRVDLTPFAALLDDGKPHTVAVRVLGAHDFFSLAGNLLAWRDHGRAVLAGQLTQNTLASQQSEQPPVQRHFEHGADGTLHGEVDTVQNGQYVIAGELQTSHGKVVTRVEQQANFANRQGFDHPSKEIYNQRIAMHTQVVDDVRTTTATGTMQYTHRLEYPLQIEVRKQVRANGDFTADITMQQGYLSKIQRTQDGHAGFWSTLDNHLVSHSNTDFNAGGTGITGSRGQHGEQSYRFSDSLGHCYARRVETRDQAVTAVESDQTCPLTL
ncbi:peptide-N4-asparagine amidase [Dyella acidiphila]|uniref:Peptide-N(4)-(N-acetyl-beta-glucosaminyl)asparagine amidase n=1 Tax=Dyella acidiphila TaxID=2775866 RepID=A0ABR9GD85_9GAMM|nr:peptide-N4-asparagine amidase [Dyella acidiphila]MBE1162012.1 peptide-N(4)-(N-acetyl-beta-glucosaminyl)asparagine amidase [Dyella acidiphila]